MRRTGRLVRVGAVLAALVVARAAGADPCADAMLKASGRHIAAQLGCYATAARQFDVVDFRCLARATAAFRAGWDRLEREGRCTGSPDAAVAGVESFVANVVASAAGLTPDTVIVGSRARQCASGKLLATSNDATAMVRCYRTGVRRGGEVDAACLMNATARLRRAWHAGGAKSACARLGDEAKVEVEVDHLATQLAGPAVSAVRPVARPRVRFSTDVQPILATRCALGGCHVGSPPAAQLDLSAGRAYESLLSGTSQWCGGPYVVPGQVGSSYVVYKLIGEILGADCYNGDPMPFPEPLTELQGANIRDWIAEGAPRD
jgi:hypothetical protein